jgi:outer membrane protein
MKRRLSAPAGMRTAALIAGLLCTALCAAPAAGQAGPLDGYIAEAIRNNLGLAQERFSEARGVAAVAEARSYFLPAVSVNARYSEAGGVLNLGDLVNPAYRALNDLTGSSGFPTNLDVQLPYRQETTLRIVQPLFNPAIAEQYRLARRMSGVQREQYGAAARRLAADVQLAWLDHARAARLVELYDRTLPLLDENVRVSERLLAAGTVTPDALFRARAERSEVAQQQAEAVHLRESARQYFNLLLDRPFGEPIALMPASSLVPVEPVTLEAALASARQNREELRQAELGIDIADSQRRLVGSGWLPTVALALDYGIQGNEYRLRRESDFGIASLVLQWNAFNGGRDVSRQRQAALDRDRAGTRRVEAERQIELQVETSHRALAVATQALATAEDRVTAARRTFELVSRRYEQGMAAQVEFLDARVAFTRAELNQILTAYDRVARWVDLEFAGALRQPHSSTR